MTVATRYNLYKSGKITKEQFLYEVRKDTSVPFITPLTSFDDAVAMLKQRRIVVETFEAPIAEQSTENAYMQGFLAGEQGADYNCPFDEDSEDYEMWCDGYNDGKNEEEGEESSLEDFYDNQINDYEANIANSEMSRHDSELYMEDVPSLREQVKDFVKKAMEGGSSMDEAKEQAREYFSTEKAALNESNKLTEGDTLSADEEKTLDFILGDSLNEGMSDTDLNQIIDRAKKIAKKGLMTAALLGALVGSVTANAQTPKEKANIKGKIEQSVGMKASDDTFLKFAKSYDEADRDPLVVKYNKELQKIKQSESLAKTPQDLDKIKASYSNLKQQISNDKEDFNTRMAFRRVYNPLLTDMFNFLKANFPEEVAGQKELFEISPELKARAAKAAYDKASNAYYYSKDGNLQNDPLEKQKRLSQASTFVRTLDPKTLEKVQSMIGSNDSVKITKARGILFLDITNNKTKESTEFEIEKDRYKVVKGMVSPEVGRKVQRVIPYLQQQELAESSSHGLNESTKPKLGADQVNPYELEKGTAYEMGYSDKPAPSWAEVSLMDIAGDFAKAQAKALKNLNKDPMYYTRLQANGGKKEKKEKEVKTAWDGYTLGKMAEDDKANVTNKKEGPVKTKGVKTMPDKGVTGTEKVMKEGIKTSVQKIREYVSAQLKKEGGEILQTQSGEYITAAKAGQGKAIADDLKKKGITAVVKPVR